MTDTSENTGEKVLSGRGSDAETVLTDERQQCFHGSMTKNPKQKRDRCETCGARCPVQTNPNKRAVCSRCF